MELGASVASSSAAQLIASMAIQADKCLDVENISKVQVLVLPLVELAS